MWSTISSSGKHSAAAAPAQHKQCPSPVTASHNITARSLHETKPAVRLMKVNTPCFSAPLSASQPLSLSTRRAAVCLSFFD